MSVRKMAEVWERSGHAGTHLLMLLAIADFADDDGRAYPSVASLARKCRMSSRNVNLILAGLRESGELQVRQNEGPRGTNLYRIPPLKPTSPLKDSSPLKPASSTPEGFFPLRLKPASDEPSMNHQEPPETRKRVAVTLKTFLSDCQSNREKPIPEDDPIFDYTDKVGISEEMLNLAWQEFKRYWLSCTKRKTDWRRTFRNAVEQNRAKLWYLKEGEAAQLTTVGEQARRAAA